MLILAHKPTCNLLIPLYFGCECMKTYVFLWQQTLESNGNPNVQTPMYWSLFLPEIFFHPIFSKNNIKKIKADHFQKGRQEWKSKKLILCGHKLYIYIYLLSIMSLMQMCCKITVSIQNNFFNQLSKYIKSAHWVGLVFNWEEFAQKVLHLVN